MAYIPQNWDVLRQKYLGDTAPVATGAAPAGAPGATGGATPASGSASPPAQVGTGRFAALRGYFDANQPAANAQAAGIAKGIDAQGHGAETKAAEAAATPENFGGAELGGEAEASRQGALESVKAAQSQSGVEGLIGQKGADYTPGMRSADAYLYGRSEPLQGVGKWEGVLSSLGTKPGAALDKPVAPDMYAYGGEPGIGTGWDSDRYMKDYYDYRAKQADYDAWQKKYDAQMKAQGT